MKKKIASKILLLPFSKQKMYFTEFYVTSRQCQSDIFKKPNWSHKTCEKKTLHGLHKIKCIVHIKSDSRVRVPSALTVRDEIWHEHVHICIN